MATEEAQYQQWMKAAQGGDELSYRKLLGEVELLATRYLSKRLTQSSDSNDVVQEILLSVHKARHSYDGSQPFLPWMYAIFNFRLKDYLRRYYRKNEREAAESEHPVKDEAAIDAEAQLEQSQLSEALLSYLEPSQRSIIEKLYIEGHSAKEVSEQMDISVANVRTRAHRAMKELKERARKVG